MGKIHLEFEKKLININDIKRIELFERWDDEKDDWFYTIEFNRPQTGNEFNNYYVFRFEDEDHRDTKFEILKMSLEDMGDGDEDSPFDPSWEIINGG